MSAVRDCLLNILAANFRIVDCSSIRNLRTCHSGVTGTKLLWGHFGILIVKLQGVHEWTQYFNFLLQEYCLRPWSVVGHCRMQ
jgi:hypothetical protein